MHAMLAFVQQNQDLTPQQGAALVAGLITIMLIGLAIGVAIHVIICLLLYTAFNRIPPEHRKFEPGLVWLLLIPLVPVVLNFFVYTRLPDSFKSYFHSIGRTDVGDCGLGLGLAYAICFACAIVPCVNYLAAPAALVLLIISLVKFTGLKNQIAAPAVV
jgi:hypothetical protein